MLPERPIISRPERQSLGQQITSGTIASIAWAIWLAIWAPFLSVVFWLLGFHITYTSIIRAPNKSSLLFILLLVLVCNIVVSSWASYNYIRFLGKSKRRGSDPVPHKEVGRFFAVTDAATLKLLLRERRINLYFDDAGGLVRAESLKTKQARKTKPTGPGKKPKKAEDDEKQLEESLVG
jgi:biofilm PGA synthesis protein PgaD